MTSKPPSPSSPSRTPVLGSTLKLPLKKASPNSPNAAESLRAEQGGDVAVPLVLEEDAGLPARTFALTSEAIRNRLAAFESSLGREVLEIADMFAKAKAQYDEENGTGQAGKRNPESVPGFVPAMAAALGRSESLVQKYLRLAKMDPATRAIIAEHPRISGNLTALLDVAAEADAEKRAEAVIAFDEAPANPLARRAKEDAIFHGVLKQFTDVKDPLGGLDAAMPPPEQLVRQFPELRGLPTVGDIRRAANDLKVSSRSDKRSPPDVFAQGLSVGIGTDTPIKLRNAVLSLKVTAVRDASGNAITDAKVLIAVIDNT